MTGKNVLQQPVYQFQNVCVKIWFIRLKKKRKKDTNNKLESKFVDGNSPLET